MINKIIFFAPNIEDGGIEKNIINLGNYFVSKNTKVEIIYSSISAKVKKKLSKRIILSKSNFRFKIPLFNERINNSIRSFLFLLIKTRFNKFDKILSFQDHPFAIISSIFNKKKCVIRIANHPYGSLFYFNNKLKFLIKIFIKIFFYQFSNLIISNSKDSTKFLRKFILSNKKCITIYNPINLNKTKSISNKRKKLILSVGRLEKQKNFLLLLKSFKVINKKYPDFKLLIIGKGRERNNLNYYIKINNLQKKVKILNFRNPKKYYKIAKLFVLTSFFEGLPNVLLEAMNNKLPIVSSNCLSGPNEILNNGKYGYLFKVDDDVDLSKKIDKALSNYKYSLNKINKGFTKLKNLSYNSQCELYLNSINEL